MRSAKLMNGRVFAGARALYRAAGVDGKDFGKPIIAIANSFDEFLPGHVHLNKVGRLISDAIKEAGGIPREFNTMAVDDGIAMGHTGMLYSLPSRDIIADTVEYQVNAHCADALICIPNCDKVVPGMLMAALRLNIPTVFVSGGPMEAGTTVLPDGTVKKNTDLIDVMYASADDNLNEEDLLAYEKTVCPTCGSCAGMFTANSMNCLTEAIGLALPGNGTILASHSYRKDLFKRAAEQVVKIAKQYYDDDDDSVLPRSIATKKAFENAMTMDVAMGGSTNTVLHILAMAQSADVDFTLDDIERISHTVPCICKASPSGEWEISDVHRAGGITGILGELDRAGKLHRDVHSIDYKSLEDKLNDWDIMRDTCTEEAKQMYLAAPGHIVSPDPWTHTTLFDSLDRDRVNGAIHDIDHPAGGPYTHVGMWFEPSLGRMDYRRVVRYRLLDHADHTAVCKTYRAYVNERGRLRTLAEKAARNPSVRDLLGRSWVHVGIKTKVQPDSSFYDPAQPGKNDSLVTFAQRERQIDESVEQPAAWETIARERPRDDQAEDEVRERCCE